MQFLSVIAIIIWSSYASPSEHLESVVIYPQPGILTGGAYETRKGRCTVSLRVSDMGGHTLLILPSKTPQRQVIEDVSGVAYLRNESLVFTASPIYGKPGIFIYGCMSKRKTRIVSPQTIDKAYPDGADYFELQDIRDNKVYFYYTPDVDSTDFTQFRNKGSLYEVNTDGSGFRKVPE